MLNRMKSALPQSPREAMGAKPGTALEEGPPIALAAHELSKDFGRRGVLRSASFTIHQGESVGLTGLQGVGKTTLVNLLLGFLAPSRGRVARFPEWARRTGAPAVGYLPQEPRFPPTFTPRGFLGYCASFSGLPRGEQDARIAEVLSAVGISGLARQPIAHLSVFEQRLVGLAQAVLARPDLLVLDGPMEGLAFDEAQALLSMIYLLKEEHQTLLVTSRSAREICPLSQRMLLLADGVVAETSPADAQAAEVCRGPVWIRLDVTPPAVVETLRGLGCRFDGNDNTFVLEEATPHLEQEILMQALRAGCRIVEVRRGAIPTERREGWA